MKRIDAVNAAKALRPSSFTDYQLLKWACDYDAQLWINVVQPYISDPTEAEAVTFPLYTSATTDYTNCKNGDFRSVLAPWDSIYIDYLVMMIDLNNADYERYNNDAMQLAEKQKDWGNALTRKNRTVSSVDDPENGRWALHLSF